jgi:hypothetical protein
VAHTGRLLIRVRLAAGDCSCTGPFLLCSPFPLLPTSCPQIFVHVVNSSSLTTCLSLPRFLLKTSNIHNFLSVGPKNMKYVLPQNLLRGAFSQKNSKKINWDQVTLLKTGLSAVQTFGPLGIKNTNYGIGHCYFTPKHHGQPKWLFAVATIILWYTWDLECS